MSRLHPPRVIQRDRHPAPGVKHIGPVTSSTSATPGNEGGPVTKSSRSARIVLERHALAHDTRASVAVLCKRPSRGGSIVAGGGAAAAGAGPRAPQPVRVRAAEFLYVKPSRGSVVGTVRRTQPVTVVARDAGPVVAAGRDRHGPAGPGRGADDRRRRLTRSAGRATRRGDARSESRRGSSPCRPSAAGAPRAGSAGSSCRHRGTSRP